MFCEYCSQTLSPCIEVHFYFVFQNKRASIDFEAFENSGGQLLLLIFIKLYCNIMSVYSILLR